MLKVGITGGIGSGKSTVCKIFGILGIPVFDSDAEANKITDKNPEVKKELIQLFGKNIYTGNGLDRKKLAAIIFEDKKSLKKVNDLIHPRVGLAFSDWLKTQASQYIIQEAAILFESGAYQFMDKIITISAPEDLRISRILTRKNMTAEKAHEIINTQWTDEQKIKMSDYVIINDQQTLILPQVLHIHHSLLEISSNNK
ncbi:MAG: dephospho-CoA kinase [Bacteroidales bacterium]|nr:dephospho-CoA kinase [Bacteroidales bacterium]